MTTPPADGHALLAVLREPGSYAAWSVTGRDGLLRLARRHGLLGTLAERLVADGLWEALPRREREILTGSRRVAAENARLLTWEVGRIRRAFFGSGIPVTLLKGCAYHLAALPMARGRMAADVDILVDWEDLPLVEKLLGQHGWRHVKVDPYDQLYYRQWMHELPPMRHWERGREVDIHHTILPRTSRLKPKARDLLQASVAARPDDPGIRVLAPTDMLLHAMTHLFYDSDFEGQLRNLVDIDALLRHFASQPGFWEGLWSRAEGLDLALPCHYGLRYCARLMETPIPAYLLARSNRGAPPAPVAMVMDRLVPRGLVPAALGNPPALASRLAGWLLYVRSHWLRMPLGLLFGHLLRKSRKRIRGHVWDRRAV
ncbi:MAG: nucleotidyltransferase family protein [Magnetococcales bacterium]|nr:nucleotidyltransferase family protein [Magnetococcales bacterium]MBF0156919.1 nucleotidyltransferase family protein [Magnetococcales bacterium]